MSEEMDLFEELGKDENVPQDVQFDDLPTNSWVYAKTATTENGGAAPTIRTYEKKDGSGDFSKFNIGLITVGGDKKVDSEKHKNAMLFFDSGIDPYEVGKGIIAGRLAGFLNATLSNGIGADLKGPERSAARWQHTLSILKGIMEQNPSMSLTDYTSDEHPEGNKALWITDLAIEYLKENSKDILVKVKQNVYKGEVKGVVAGACEEASGANMENRKVTMFETEESLTY